MGDILMLFSGIKTILTLVLGAALGGNPFMISISALAGQNYIPMWEVLVFCYIGTILSDLFWFSLARTEWANNVVDKIHKRHTHRLKHHGILDLLQKNRFLSIFISKFIYGTRTIVILYLSRKQMSRKEFYKYDLPSSFVWVMFLGLVGWSVGNGFSHIEGAFSSIRLILTVVFLGMVLLFIISRIASFFVQRHLKQN